MRSSGPLDDTWKEGRRSDAGDSSPTPDGAVLDAAKAWLVRAIRARLKIHMLAAEPGNAEREMAFTAMADELRDALEHLRAVLAVADDLKAENTVLRKAAERQRAKGTPAPPIT